MGYDFSDTMDDHKVTGSFRSNEDEIFDVEIGEVTLSNEKEMPFEIEINGTIYKREN